MLTTKAHLTDATDEGLIVATRECESVDRNKGIRRRDIETL
jgi:hypothetical protein